MYVHHYTGAGIFDSEICNKWCSFLTKEQYLFIVVFFTFYFDSVTLLKTYNISQVIVFSQNLMW